MKINPTNADEYFPNELDLKLSHVLEVDQKNFESALKWIYIGADIRDAYYAKVGLTTGDLQSRSYSSARPTYYLFCGFKARHDISKERLEIIEKNILYELDNKYRFAEYRLKHAESSELSECYFGIPFSRVFRSVHQVIYDNHSNDFITCEYESRFNGFSRGSSIKCVFNHKLVPNTAYYEDVMIQRE